MDQGQRQRRRVRVSGASVPDALARAAMDSSLTAVTRAASGSATMATPPPRVGVGVELAGWGTASRAEAAVAAECATRNDTSEATVEHG